MKYGVGYLHTVLLSICDFREKRLMEGRNYVASINKISFVRVRQNRMTP
jgi:hypothetical protein